MRNAPFTRGLAQTSQFENHLRAILGLPLGDTAALGHAAMANLIGYAPAPEPAALVLASSRAPKKAATEESRP